MLKASDIKY